MRRAGYALIALAVIGCTSKSGEITIYPLLCNESLQNDSCHGEWLLLNKTVYRISAKQQTVTYWSPMKSDLPKKLTKCVVRDVRNWQCSDTDGSADDRMEAGKFSRQIGDDGGSALDKKYEMRTRYVSRFQYWKIWLRSWLFSPSEY
jgi:hypothetical protein